MCDGQQRLTTLYLILAAAKSVASESQQTKIVDMINMMLFTCKAEQLKDLNFREGEYVEQVKFIPTFIDRMQFYEALFDRIPSNSSSLITRCFKFFKSRIKTQMSSPKDLQLFLLNLLQNLKFIYFETFDTKKSASLYEGLAVKNKILRNEFEPKQRPGKDLLAKDFIRNFMLDFFVSDHDKTQFYRDHWLNLERVVPDGDQFD